MIAAIDADGHRSLFDYIMVELRDTSSSHALVWAAKDTISVRGLCKFEIPDSLSGNFYFIVVYHRNSIATWSKNPIAFNSTNISFDFTRNDSIVVNNPVPVLNTIAPTSALAGTAGFTLNLSGSNFITNSVAQWNGASLTTTFISSSQLTAVVHFHRTKADYSEC